MVTFTVMRHDLGSNKVREVHTVRWNGNSIGEIEIGRFRGTTDQYANVWVFLIRDGVYLSKNELKEIHDYMEELPKQ